MEKEFLGYMVDSRGFVWKKDHSGPKSERLGKTGYHRVNLAYKENGKWIIKPFMVHRLVAELFCDKPEGCNVVNHLDSDITNNDYRNLEWTTIQGNTLHGYLYGNVKSALDKAVAASIEVLTKHYNVYKNDLLVASGLTKKEVIDLVGCNEKTVRNCVKENRKSRNGYFFEEV